MVKLQCEGADSSYLLFSPCFQTFKAVLRKLEQGLYESPHEVRDNILALFGAERTFHPDRKTRGEGKVKQKQVTNIGHGVEAYCRRREVPFEATSVPTAISSTCRTEHRISGRCRCFLQRAPANPRGVFVSSGFNTAAPNTFFSFVSVATVQRSRKRMTCERR